MCLDVNVLGHISNAYNLSVSSMTPSSTSITGLLNSGIGPRLTDISFTGTPSVSDTAYQHARIFGGFIGRQPCARGLILF